MEIKVKNTENKNEVKISFKVEAEKFENAGRGRARTAHRVG